MAGLVGSGDRLDYTVVGDSVNVAARLCEAAGEGEVIVDADSAGLADRYSFAPEESLQVKGRSGAIRVRRMEAPETVSPSPGSSRQPAGIEGR